jgi:hypothetical protein
MITAADIITQAITQHNHTPPVPGPSQQPDSPFNILNDPLIISDEVLADLIHEPSGSMEIDNHDPSIDPSITSGSK